MQPGSKRGRERERGVSHAAIIKLEPRVDRSRQPRCCKPLAGTWRPWPRGMRAFLRSCSHGIGRRERRSRSNASWVAVHTGRCFADVQPVAVRLSSRAHQRPTVHGGYHIAIFDKIYLNLGIPEQMKWASWHSKHRKILGPTCGLIDIKASGRWR